MGIDGENFQNFLDRNTGIGNGNRGFNIQNEANFASRRAAYTVTFEAIVLIPKRDTTGFGLHGDEFILDPSLSVRSRVESESVPILDWMVLSTDHHARLNLGALGINDAIADGFTHLVIDYTFIYANRDPAYNQFINLMNNDHGRADANVIGRSAAMNKSGILTEPLVIPLSGGLGGDNQSMAVTDMLSFVCTPTGRVLFRINSMRLIK